MTSVAESPGLHVIRGPILIPIGLLIIAITIASFFSEGLAGHSLHRGSTAH